MEKQQDNNPERIRLEEQLKNLSCTTYFDGLVFCTTPTNQFKSLYRFGQLDDCAEAVNGLKACMAIKINKISNKEKALEQLKATGNETYNVNYKCTRRDYKHYHII